MQRQGDDRRRRPGRGAIGAAAALPVLLVALCATASVAAVPSLSVRARTAGAQAGLRLGSRTLTRCQTKPVAYCGKLAVPLDYSSPAGPEISVAYEFLPAAAGAAKGTVVPVEGGPGYPSIGSVSYSSAGGRAGYGPMYGPLLEHWNMLVVDNRGTGASAALSCAPLQDFAGPTGSSAFEKVVGECGQRPEHTLALPGRLARARLRPVHLGTGGGRTWRPCCARSESAGSTSTATPTGRSSRRCSPPATPRWCAA